MSEVPPLSPEAAAALPALARTYPFMTDFEAAELRQECLRMAVMLLREAAWIDATPVELATTFFGYAAGPHDSSPLLRPRREHALRLAVDYCRARPSAPPPIEVAEAFRSFLDAPKGAAE